MSDNSIEKHLGIQYPISVSDRQFIADMRKAAADAVGYGFMQQVIEWEWQDHDEIGAWGPEYFERERKQVADALGHKSEMIDSMESVMSQIGDALGVEDGDVPTLLMRIGNGIRAQAAEDESRKRIGQLEAALEQANPRKVFMDACALSHGYTQADSLDSEKAWRKYRDEKGPATDG